MGLNKWEIPIHFTNFDGIPHTFTSSTFFFINLDSQPDSMEKLMCCRHNTMASIKDPNHRTGLVPCIGKDCDRWRDDGIDPIKLRREKTR